MSRLCAEVLAIRGDDMEHTPGPWTVDGSDVHASGFIVAQVSWRLEEWEANARLIAAAPELLKALEPFAALLQPHVEARAHRGDDTPVFRIDDAEITVGDLRRARALIEKNKS
jgi:hypothetical protein